MVLHAAQKLLAAAELQHFCHLLEGTKAVLLITKLHSLEFHKSTKERLAGTEAVEFVVFVGN